MAAYPDVDPSLVAGEYQGALSNGGETIKVEDTQNSTIIEFRYEDGRDVGEEDWHVSTDGDGFSLVIRDELGELSNWDLGTGWRPSETVGGSPGVPAVQVVGDFDQDGNLDADDLDLLSAGVRQGELRFDLNNDGFANEEDRSLMISAILHSKVGDSNLDGQFDSRDIVQVFTAGKFEDALPNNAGWADGDWNGDGDFTSSDIVFAFQAGTYSAARPLLSVLDIASWATDNPFFETRLQQEMREASSLPGFAATDAIFRDLSQSSWKYTP